MSTKEFETREKGWATVCAAKTTLLGFLQKKKQQQKLVPDLLQNYAACSLALKKKSNPCFMNLVIPRAQ